MYKENVSMDRILFQHGRIKIIAVTNNCVIVTGLREEVEKYTGDA